MATTAYNWSTETFRDAELGDERRVRRLVSMGARALEKPDGRISTVFSDRREREGAYDFVENRAFSADTIAMALARSTARAASRESVVLLPMDGSSIKLWDGTGQKDFGRIGTHTNGATGIKVMTGMALALNGTPIGIAAQTWWTRPKHKLDKPHHDRLPVGKKETAQWLLAIQQVERAFKLEAPDTCCWFQLDRGADAWPVLAYLSQSAHLFTVRNSADRCLEGESQTHLRETLRKQPVAARFHCRVEERVGHKTLSDRKGRIAVLTIRAVKVSLCLYDKRTGKEHPTELNGVLVLESRTTPIGEPPIEWVLITNHPIDSSDDLREIVRAYNLRWRIEEFHKTWKSGQCNVENTQLQSFAAVTRWATILAAVAARTERIKVLSRTTPDAPATEEFSDDELQALKLLRREFGPRQERQPQRLTMKVATYWLAELGGYTGKSSGGPPGSITIKRGLDKLVTAALIVRQIGLQTK